jgi:hypothetical protein
MNEFTLDALAIIGSIFLLCLMWYAVSLQKEEIRQSKIKYEEFITRCSAKDGHIESGETRWKFDCRAGKQTEILESVQL